MPLGPTHGGAWPRRPGPSPRFPPLRGASHLSIFCCQLANARGLPRPAPRAPRVPSPTPGEDALVPAPHRNPRPRRDPPGSPRFPPGGRRAMPCHAGWTARRPRSMQRRPLPGYRQTATSLRHQETRRQPTTPPRSRSRHAMPSHPPHRPSRTTPMQTHRPSLASNRARKRSAVPTRFSGGHTNAHKVGHHRPASQVLRSPPSLSTGENRSRATSGPRLDHPPSQSEARAGPPRHRPSHPLPSNAANWQRAGHIEIAPPGTYQGTSKAPGTFYYS